MSGLTNVSARGTDGREIETRLNTEEILTAGVSRENVASSIATAILAKATKTYVDTQDSTYAPVGYYSAQDALLVPNGAKGVASGVASLDGSSKVPQAQVPTLGAGILRGPWGPNQAFAATTTTTPAKIAQWNLGISGVIGQPWVWLCTSAAATGRPVIEVRIGDNTQTTYAAQTLIAQGFGRSWYNDYQVITAIPVTALNSEGADGVQDNYSPATNLLLNAWIYDSEGGQVTTTAGSIASAPLYFARTAL